MKPSKNLKIFLVSLLVALMVSSLALPVRASAGISYPLAPADKEVASALSYLHSQQKNDGSIGSFSTSAWVVMAIAAAGEDPHSWKKGGKSIVDYLRSNSDQLDPNKPLDWARQILAITAAGEDPTNFGGINYVAKLKSFYNNNQIGDPALLNDDFWGVMALISAGESPNSAIVQNSVAFIKAGQKGDGGWAFDVAASWGTDVDDTAAAIMALMAAGESPSSAAIKEGLNYLKNNQADNGGFLSWGATNADTDSWAICAIRAAGYDPTSANWTKNGKTPLDDLVSFQQPDGCFHWQSGNPGWDVPKTTACAIVALLGKPYPVKIFHPSASEKIPPEQIVQYSSLAKAVEEVKSLGIQEAARVLSKVKEERAGQVLGELDLRRRADIILEMSQESLKKVLPEIPPHKLFEIPPQKLWEKLPDVPTEQLIGEVPPQAPPDLPPAKEIEATSRSAVYQFPEARAGEWTFTRLSLCPFTSFMFKPNKDLEDVEVDVKVLTTRPPGVKLPPGYPYLSLYSNISLKNIRPENLEAARLTFKLRKDILEFMSHNKFSILLQRWDEGSGRWIPIPTKRIGEDSQFVYYSTIVPGFSIFTLTGSRVIPAPEFDLSELKISPTEVLAGQEVTITAKVTNLTDQAQAYTAVLWINQTAEKAQSIEVPARGEELLSFKVVKSTVGEYQVRIDKLMGSFTVKEAPDKVAPEIISWHPESLTEQTRPVIEVEYRDEGTGVDASSVNLLVDGRDVTSETKVTQEKATYRPAEELEEGQHKVKVSLTDLAGNKTTKEWAFNVKVVPQLPGAEKEAQDLDGDGLYEDTNGDGKIDSNDVALLFEDLNSELVRRKAELFDFNQNGRIDYDDVVELSQKAIPSGLTLALGEGRGAVGETISIPLTLYSANEGLCGFDLEVFLNGAIAEITQVEAAHFGLTQVLGQLPASRIRIRAVDLDDLVSPGAKERVLAWLKLRGKAPGKTTLRLSLRAMDDEEGKTLKPRLVFGKVKIK